MMALSSGEAIPEFGSSLPGLTNLATAGKDTGPVKNAFTLTKGQRSRLSESTGGDEDKMRGAVVQSIIRGDASLGPYTDEQRRSAREFAIARGKFGVR